MANEARAQRTGFLPPLALWLVASAYYASYAAYGNITQDEGWLLESSLRVLGGQVPHRDFVSIYPAGRYALFAAVLGLFDGDLLAVRGVWCVLRGAVVALVFALARRIAPAPFAVAAAAFALLLPGPWHKTFFSLVPLATLAAFGCWLADGRRRWLVLAGLAAGFGTWFRHDVGLAAIAVVTPTIAFARSYSGDPREQLRAVAAFVVPASLAIAAGFLAIATDAGVLEVLDQLLLRALQEGAPQGATAGSGPLAWLPRAAVGLSLLIAVAAVARMRRNGRNARDTLTLAIAALALLTANQMFRYPIVVRALQCGPIFYVLWFHGVAASARRLTAIPGARAIAIAAGFLLPAVAATTLLAGAKIGLPVEYSGTITVRYQRTLPYTLPSGSTIHVDRNWASQVNFVRAAIERDVPPQGAIAVLGRPSSAYFLTGRSNPSRLIRFDDTGATRKEREAALAAILARCDTIVADGSFLRHRGRWWKTRIQRNFRVTDRRGPIEILARNPEAPSR